MEVLSVADVYENTTRWQHCGITVLMNTSQNNNHSWEMIIPLGDEKTKLVVNSCDVKQVVYSPKEDVAGVILHPVRTMPGKSSAGLFSLFLKMTTDNEEVGSGSHELSYLLKFLSKYSPEIKPLMMSSQRELSKFFEKENLANVFKVLYPPGGKKTPINKDGLEGLKGWKCCLADDEESVGCVHRQFRPYFRPYLYFVLDNQEEGKKKTKMTLKNIDNIPKFAKQHSWNHEVHLMKALGNFFLHHCCYNVNCDSFAYLKCSDCLAARYCGTSCQAQDYSRHKYECAVKNHFRRQNYLIAYSLEIMIRKYLQHCDFLEIDTFMRVLNYRVYECFYGAMSVQNSKTSDWINSNMLSGLPAVKSKQKMLCLLKENRKSRTKTLKEIRSQIERVYGEENILSRIWLRDLSRDPMHLLDNMFASLFNKLDI